MLCDDCRNAYICKYLKEAKTTWEQIISVAPDNVLSPVKARIECNKFEKKGTKQDGIGMLSKTYMKVGD